MKRAKNKSTPDQVRSLASKHKSILASPRDFKGEHRWNQTGSGEGVAADCDERYQALRPLPSTGCRE